MHFVAERYVRPSRVRGWEPNLHPVKGTTDYWNALSYFVKSYVGPGCLALPIGFQRAGLGLSIAVLTFAVTMSTNNQYSLMKCQRSVKHLGINNYKSLTRFALGPLGESFLEVVINTQQLGICCIYFSFISENLHAMLSGYQESFFTSRTACFIYISPIFALSALLPNVDAIAPYTKLANLLVVTPIVIVLVYSGLQLATHGISPEVNTIVFNASTPLFFGSAIFAVSGINNLFPVENSLQSPDQIWSIVRLGMTIVSCLYMSIGIVSYLAWPGISNGSITAELSERLGGPVLSAAGVMVIVAVLMTFPVQLFPAAELWELRAGLEVPLKPNQRPSSSSPSSPSSLGQGNKKDANGASSSEQAAKRNAASGVEIELGSMNGQAANNGRKNGSDLRHQGRRNTEKNQSEKEAKFADSQSSYDKDYDEDDDEDEEEGLLEATRIEEDEETGSSRNGGFDDEEKGIGESSSKKTKSMNGSHQSRKTKQQEEEELQRIRSSKRLKYGEKLRRGGGSMNTGDDYKRVLLKLSLIAACGCTAYVVENLEQLVGVIGSLGGTFVSFVFPALISLYSRPVKDRSALSKFLDILSLVFGLVAGSWGAFTSLQYNSTTK